MAQMANVTLDTPRARPLLNANASVNGCAKKRWDVNEPGRRSYATAILSVSLASQG